MRTRAARAKGADLVGHINNRETTFMQCGVSVRAAAPGAGTSLRLLAVRLGRAPAREGGEAVCWMAARGRWRAAGRSERKPRRLVNRSQPSLVAMRLKECHLSPSIAASLVRSRGAAPNPTHER